MAKKVIKLSAEQTGKEKENIEILQLLKDRLILEPIQVDPIRQSPIIDPNTNKPIEDKAHFDRYPFRCKVRYCGEDIIKETPIREGNTLFIETYQATSQIVINGELLITTRLSNVLLVYSDNQKKDEKK